MHAHITEVDDVDCPANCLAVLSEGVTIGRLQEEAAIRPAAAAWLF